MLLLAIYPARPIMIWAGVDSRQLTVLLHHGPPSENARSPKANQSVKLESVDIR